MIPEDTIPARAIFRSRLPPEILPSRAILEEAVHSETPLPDPILQPSVPGSILQRAILQDKLLQQFDQKAIPLQRLLPVLLETTILQTAILLGAILERAIPRPTLAQKLVLRGVLLPWVVPAAFHLHLIDFMIICSISSYVIGFIMDYISSFVICVIVWLSSIHLIQFSWNGDPSN